MKLTAKAFRVQEGTQPVGLYDPFICVCCQQIIA